MLLDLFDEVLGDDDVFILESIADAKKNNEENLRVTLIITLKDNLLSISKIIKIIEVCSKVLFVVVMVMNMPTQMLGLRHILE